MPRPLRQEEPGAVNHVVARGNNKELIFRDDVDRRTYVDLLRKTTERMGWVVLAYCLMPNHVHLLIETPRPNLGRGMQWFHGHYGRYFNDRHDRVGHVFQGRYKAIKQQTDEQFQRVRAYIALNPFEAGLVRAGAPYPWARDNIGPDGFEPAPRATAGDDGSCEKMQPVSERAANDRIAKATVGDVQRLDGPVHLAEPDPAWPDHFEQVATRIRRALGDKALRIEHVGSTSVPGLVAKPIIDVVLEVADSADEAAYVPPLEHERFVLRIREPEWHEHRMLKGQDPEVNLHVFGRGCPEIDRMIRFRDLLREDRAALQRYAEHKRALAARHWEHIQHYADAKTATIDEIVGQTSGRYVPNDHRWPSGSRTAKSRDP